MKLLLDENISYKVIPRIIDLYAESRHVFDLGMGKTNDALIWEYGKNNDFIIVSKDSDFREQSILKGHPPKLIYMGLKNCPTSEIVKILRVNFFIINDFNNNPLLSILTLLA